MNRTYEGFQPRIADRRDWVLGRLLELRARTHGERPFLRYMDRAPLTYREANLITNRAAWGLAELGVRRGERVLVMLPNCLEYLWIWWGANKLGAIEVPVNNAYKGIFLEHVVNNSGARLMVIDGELAPRLLAIEERLSSLETVLVYGSAVDETPLPFRRLQVLPLDRLYAHKESNPDVDVRPHEIAAVMYTSGTTGPSKGVRMPHAQGYFASDEGAQLVRLEENDVYYTCSPFFHVNAQMLTVYPCLVVGAQAVIYPYFSASEWIDQIRISGASVANFLGVMMDFVCHQPPRAQDRDNRLRCVFSVPTPAGIVNEFRQRFDVETTVEAYGMTEISLPIMLPYGEHRPGASGKAVADWFDVRIVDPDTDAELAPGSIGELVVRHKEPWTLNAGYLGMPEKTAEAYRNLWFHTGDALRCDEDGYFYFVDRIKDALRRRGENISSYEVERVVGAHPAVAECAVIAIAAREQGGEDEVKVCITRTPGADPSPEAIVSWCDSRMPYFAVPRYVEFVDELPKTPNLKIQKQKLREAGVTPATWDRVEAGFRLDEELQRQRRGKQPSKG
ncbi:MAG: AMP-binding protein [Deltaproteobacteria bacterium]|nr:AMP-binding protein [Deltaproteobacteria bacterium]